MQFGLITQGFSILEDINLLKATGIKLARVPVLYDTKFYSGNADILLKQGFDVALNFNHMPTNVPGLFCRDLKFVSKRTNILFDYYFNYKKQIPFVAVENEWDNPYYRNFNDATISDYIALLKLVTDIGHAYGFKIADAGITMSGLTSWHYSNLSGKEAKEWKRRFNVPTRNKDFGKYITLINSFIEQAKSLDYDFLNFHWYNAKHEHLGGLKEALASYVQATGKTSIITNEFGVRNDATLWDDTVKEIAEINPLYAIAYSGRNEAGKAIQLTDEQLKLLNYGNV